MQVSWAPDGQSVIATMGSGDIAVLDITRVSPITLFYLKYDCIEQIKTFFIIRGVFVAFFKDATCHPALAPSLWSSITVMSLTDICRGLVMEAFGM